MGSNAVCGEERTSAPDRERADTGGTLSETDRLRLELRQQQHALERIARGESVAETLTELCHNVERRYPDSFCTILTVDRAAGVLRHAASPSLPRDFADQIDGLPVGDGMAACGTAAGRGTVVIVDDVFADPLTDTFHDLATRFDLASVWSHPLLTPGGEVLGTFAVYRREPHTPDAEELAFVANAGNLAALAIDRARSEVTLQAAANLDPLTGLPNRARFLELLGHKLQLPGRRLGVIFLEVDRYQQLADSVGYLTADQVLIEISNRLQKVLSEHGVVSRFGVYRFTAMVTVRDTASLQVLADKVLAEISQPLDVEGVELFMTASVGCVTNRPGADAYALVSDAHSAMHAARSAGPGHQQLYDRKLRSRMVSRLRTETELRRAIEQHELVMHYQPILSVRDQIWSGVEALVRWQHPRRGLVAPDGFIPLAEDTGLIVPLGERVLELVCDQARRWADKLPDIRVAVNASVMQLAHPNAAPVIEEMLERAGLAPSALVLEVTETALMERLDSTRGALERLVDDGISVLIDDFGTGYSSLARLGELPISGLKIDRRFVRGLGVDPAVEPVVKAIADLARAYNLEVVVEGIENPEALSGVVALGCEYAQGFHLGRPAVAEVVEQQLARPVPLRDRIT
jgi:c-di-GMP-specific phosphodiesterase